MLYICMGKFKGSGLEVQRSRPATTAFAYDQALQVEDASAQADLHTLNLQPATRQDRSLPRGSNVVPFRLCPVFCLWVKMYYPKKNYSRAFA